MPTFNKRLIFFQSPATRGIFSYQSVGQQEMSTNLFMSFSPMHAAQTNPVTPSSAGFVSPHLNHLLINKLEFM